MPSGTSAGDTLLMAGQNDILRLNPPFIFYGQARSEMYIHENGLVSFGLCQECPVVIDFSFATPPLIAPLWFEAATLQGNVLYRITTGTETLTASRNYILSELGEDFSPSYVVVITWTEVPGPPCLGATGRTATSCLLMPMFRCQETYKWDLVMEMDLVSEELPPFLWGTLAH